MVTWMLLLAGIGCAPDPEARKPADTAAPTASGTGTPPSTGSATGATPTGGGSTATGSAGTGTATGSAGTGSGVGTGGAGTGGTAGGTGTGGTGTGTGGDTGDTAPPRDSGHFDCDYTGPWPCNPDKDAWVDPGFDAPLAVGDRIPRFVGVDQFGDPVELWDFLNHGDRPVLLQLQATWDYNGTLWADWLGGGHDELGFGPEIPDAITAGDLDHVIVLVDDADGDGPVCPADCAAYEARVESRPTAVLGDADQELRAALPPPWYPLFVIVESDGTITWIDGTSSPYFGEFLAVLFDRF